MCDEQKLEMISAYVDDELSSSDRRMVEQWLQASSDCRRHYDELIQLRQHFAAAREAGEFGHRGAEPLGRDLGPAIMARIGELPPREKHADEEAVRVPATRSKRVYVRATRWAVWAAVAAVLTMMVVWNRGPSDPHGTGQGMGIATIPSVPDSGTSPRPGDPTTKQESDPSSDMPGPGNDTQFVAAQPAIFLMVEVELKATAKNQGVLAAAMKQAGVGMSDPIAVDADLEDALVNSHLFGKQAPGVPTPNEAEVGAKLSSVVYAVLNGPQLDSVFSQLKAERAKNGMVSKVVIDLAMLPADKSLFDVLHQSAEMQIASTEPPPVSAPEQPTLLLRAQRIALSAALQTRLGLGMRVLSVPALGVMGVLTSQQGSTSENGSQPTDGEAIRVTEAQRHAMAAQTTGVLFVVRTAAE
ncbi:MAG: zf-HC2 domain-containing protein [Planctomycetales bacterium]|nr:zf-HC2 domain-containing protein [Planctomycetales bacterium]